MAVDVSHLSDAGIDDVLRLSPRPRRSPPIPMRAPCSIRPRSLRAMSTSAPIAAAGGTIGVNFYNRQLTRRPVACVDDVVRQIEHICAVGGAACCAVGSDFDGMPVYPQGLSDSRGFPAAGPMRCCAPALPKRDVRAVLYENLRRYILQFV